MRKSNQIVQNFFYEINDNDILNVLYSLTLILNIPEHKKRLQEILDISNPGCSFDDFSEAVAQEVYYSENLLKEDSKYLMDKSITENKTNPTEDAPAIRCFIALYWSYYLKNKDQDSSLKIYNPRVGDVALKFLLYFLRMKQKETHVGCAIHENGFYEDLSARLVRIIDILSVMDAEDNKYLQKTYFPDSKSDLALNFLKIQIENIWEQNSLSVIEPSKTEKSTILYRHSGENLNFKIKPSRMTKSGAFRDLDKTYSQLMQLYNLDLVNAKKRYSLNKKRTISKKKISLAIDPLEEELIYEDASIDPEILTNEDKIEQLSKRKVYRRDMKDFSDTDEDSKEEAKEYVIPNAFQQHKRNIAFSSALSKQNLLLKSDYDIPITQHLKAFISTLNTNDEEIVK